MDSPRPAPPAAHGSTGEPAVVIFDIDGTLADTNYLHALAWRRAFLEHGFDVPTAAVHRMIGAGSGVLLRELVGEEHDGVREGWRRRFDELKPEIRSLPGAADLVRAVTDRGALAVLASSSEPEDVEALREALGCDDVLAAVTDAGDVDEAKPEPEVFQAALDRVDAARGRAVVVGDSVWDVKAAARIGLPTVAVLTGGTSEHDLRDAGAVAVYDSPQDLLAGLDQSPIGALIAEHAGSAGHGTEEVADR